LQVLEEQDQGPGVANSVNQLGDAPDQLISKAGTLGVTSTDNQSPEGGTFRVGAAAVKIESIGEETKGTISFKPFGPTVDDGQPSQRRSGNSLGHQPGFPDTDLTCDQEPGRPP
jgi:hypothetical protein